jgi:AcrR family transcriptional regulator
MSRAPQQRRLETRERLLGAARASVAEHGIAGLRTEDIVERAGVAKGTFFSHFPDKEHLLAVLTAERLRSAREHAQSAVENVDQVLQSLLPILQEMIAEPAMLTALVRFGGPSTSGVGLYEELCAQQMHLQAILTTLQVHGRVRSDVDAALLGEGVHAFLFHAAAAALCGAPGTDPHARGRALFIQFVTTWLLPGSLR